MNVNGSREINFLLVGVNAFCLGRKEMAVSAGGQHRDGALMEAGHASCVLAPDSLAVSWLELAMVRAPQHNLHVLVVLWEPTVQPGVWVPAFLLLLVQAPSPSQKET